MRLSEDLLASIEFAAIRFRIRFNVSAGYFLVGTPIEGAINIGRKTNIAFKALSMKKLRSPAKKIREKRLRKQIPKLHEVALSEQTPPRRGKAGRKPKTELYLFIYRALQDVTFCWNHGLTRIRVLLIAGEAYDEVFETEEFKSKGKQTHWRMGRIGRESLRQKIINARKHVKPIS